MEFGLLAVSSLVRCVRARLCRWRTRLCIPAKRSGFWPVSFHLGYYRRRHGVENFFFRIKRYRRLSTRYEKLAITFLAFVQLAAVVDWLLHCFCIHALAVIFRFASRASPPMIAA